MIASLNEEEKALVAYLLESPKESLLVLTEDFHPGTKGVLDSVREVQRSYPDLEVIEGIYSHYERFANTQDIFGFPAILHFLRGELKAVLLGVVSADEMIKLLS